MQNRRNHIETLPDSALPITQWVYDAIMSRRMEQKDILETLNGYLVQIDIDAVSTSTFSRYARRVLQGRTSRPSPIPPIPHPNKDEHTQTDESMVANNAAGIVG